MQHTLNERDQHGAPRDSLVFDSFTEAITFAELKSHEDSGARADRPSFTGTRTYDEAHTLATCGWPDGRKQIERLHASLLEHVDVAHYSTISECVYDVVGNGGWDMGRVLEGTPECAMDWRESERLNATTTRGSKIVRIAFNFSASSAISPDAMMRRGACTIALIDALELAGYSVEVIGFSVMSETYEGMRKATTAYGVNRIPIKTAGELLQADQIVFALAHPSMLRRIGFSLIRQTGPTWAITAEQGSYGYPAPIPTQDAIGFDIIMPDMHYGNNQWDSVSSVTNYFRKTLAEFGIALASIDK